MRCFQKLGDVDVQPLLHQLVRHPDLWNTDRWRQTFAGTPHSAVDDILVRFPDTRTLDGGNLSPKWYPASNVLTAIKPLVLNVMRVVEGYELGSVLISRLRPGGVILPHKDDGEYGTMGWRYHIVLQGLPGSLFHCGSEMVCMQTGQVWWFDHMQQHMVENNSPDDRIHLMIDCRVWA